QYGIGTFGSRATAVGGTAVYIAIERLKEKATKIAAHLLGTDAASVFFAEGKFTRGGAKKVTTAAGTDPGEVPEPILPAGRDPAGALPEPEADGKHVTLQDVAVAAHLAKDLPPDMEPGLSATYFFEPNNFTF